MMETGATDIRDVVKAYKNSTIQIRRIRERMENVETLAEGCAIDPSKEKVQSSPRPDKFGDLVSEYADLEVELLKEIDHNLSLQHALYDAASDLSQSQAEVFIQRDILGKEWGLISQDIGYSTRHLLRLHHEAIDAINAGIPA